MRDNHGKGVHTAPLVLVLVLAAAAGCTLGQGAPDGWRYLRGGPIDVALPKTWRPTARGAVLPGASGRADGELTIAAAARPSRPAASHAAPAAPGPAGPVRGEDPPADARRRTLTLDGRPARFYAYARPAPDGRPAGYVEVRVTDPAGRPLTVRAWAVDGAGHDPALLQEIVNGIEFPPATAATAATAAPAATAVPTATPRPPAPPATAAPTRPAAP